MPTPLRHPPRHPLHLRTPVSESVMELRMRPATDGRQRCLQFELEVQPRARVFAYRDCLGNWVHHFDIPRRHAPAGDHVARAGAGRRAAVAAATR